MDSFNNKEQVMRCFLIFSMCLIVPVICFAAANEAEEDDFAAQQKLALKNIPQLVEQYASTQGCNFNMQSRNVVSYPLNGQEAFIALFSLDWGCTGGSSMATTSLAVLEWSESYPRLYVNAAHSRVAADFPMLVDKIFVKDKQLWYSALSLQGQDALCCPTGKTTGKLVFKNDAWRTTK